MRIKYGLFFFFLLFCRLTFAQNAVDREISKLNWLEGKWERENTKDGRTAFEIWANQESELRGEGITTRGADTVFVEELSITSKAGSLFYVAKVSSNAAPVYFRVTQITGAGFVCKNTDHDFPKKIEYKLEEAGSMKVIISGSGKSIPFIFRKISK